MIQQEFKNQYSQKNENELGKHVLDIAIMLHKRIGPGLNNGVYESIIAHELRQRDIKALSNVVVPIVYKGLKIKEGFRLGVLVENKVIIHIVDESKTSPLHKKKLLTYLKLRNIKLGFLLNFNVLLMKDGIMRVINGKI